MVGQAGFRSDNIAIAVNLLAQRFRAIQLLAGRRQHFDAAPVIDLVLGHEIVPWLPKVRAGLVPVAATTLNFAAMKCTS